MKTLYENYATLNLAILYVAMDDYYKLTRQYLKAIDKKKKLESKIRLTEKERKELKICNDRINFDSKRKAIITWWKRVYSKFYSELLDYDAIIERFNDIEEQAKKDYKQNQKNSKGSIIWKMN